MTADPVDLVYDFREVTEADLSMLRAWLAEQHIAEWWGDDAEASLAEIREDRKSTRLNSSHSSIWYAVFCLKKKKRRLARRGALRHRRLAELNRRGAGAAALFRSLAVGVERRGRPRAARRGRRRARSTRRRR